MRRFLVLASFTLISCTLFGQVKMRSLDQLINKEEPGWALVTEWIAAAKNKVEVLPADSLKAKDALYKIQVTTRSPMGAIVYSTSGLLIDNGWIRILGSGGEKMNRSLPEWNKGKAFDSFGEPAPYLLIADDVLGGFFLLNGGGLGTDLGKVYYFAPDNLEFEPLDLTYSDFLNFCFNYDMDDFYKGYRWNNWKIDVAKLTGDQVFNFIPYLWTKEGKDIANASKSAVSAEAQYLLNLDLRKQLGIDK
ncbi:MAG TPA: DUF2625 domain-containing protein [Flavobacteriaceae bacterium]|nr:DUF2625 domain-containing protein [Flavobacteriaceae bacterium]HQU21315.1 DUF2625 domain-containing protein [Flavobacteriaceae bacterium]HQU66524.1 DUF2625 domain-containing protein [Flavobacteriaceae bacterium]HRW45275.1 DUF2625 domain-containing protein [Flavobacteriaceae bacterium]